MEYPLSVLQDTCIVKSNKKDNFDKVIKSHNA